MGRCPQDELTPPDGMLCAGALAEAAYQVVRGVRALAIVGRVAPEEAEIARIHLESNAGSSRGGLATLVGFMITTERGVCLGYAAAPWVEDLYRWLLTSSVPAHQRDRIQGLLLGYSPQAIQDFTNAHTLFDGEIITSPLAVEADPGDR